jgi:methylated-DNA-[protein]-cysteine S-methyltransferase
MKPNATVLEMTHPGAGTLAYQSLESPVGELTLLADDSALVAILWETEHYNRDQFGPSTPAVDHLILRKTRQQLEEYFGGGRREFDLPLCPRGTCFQMRVWSGLRDIPYGELWSYGRLARHIGQDGAARAVGAANGRNPIPIIIPCHRVIGSDGTLTGFGGGLDVKARLIAIERGDNGGPWGSL